MNRDQRMTVCRASAGTGKTYTLAAYYVALLMAGESYRSILAVTFTNKATIEMKERILTFLYGIARQPKLLDTRDFMDAVRKMGKMLNEKGTKNAVFDMSDEAMSQKASELFAQILADYDNMRVSTIDSFLQVLLTGMARSLCKAAGFEVELDSEMVINEAVDQLLTTYITSEANLEQTIYDYVEDNMRKDDKWDIRSGLLALANELTKESVQCRQIDKDPTKIQRFIQAVEGQYPDDNVDYNLTVENLRDLMLIDYIRRRMNACLGERNSVLLADTAMILEGALREGDADFILEQVGIRYHHIMLDEFQDTSTMQWRNFEHLIRSILSEGGTVFIVGDVKQSIYRFRNGDWSIMANLTAGHPQYGGYYNPLSLSCNYRSQKYVVQFNQRLFAGLAPYINDINTRLANYYNEGYSEPELGRFYQTREADKKNHIGHEYGYVQVTAYPCFTRSNKNMTEVQLGSKYNPQVKEMVVRDMFAKIAQRMDKGDKAKDMMILVQRKQDAQYIVDTFEHLKAEDACWKNVTITSRNSYQLDGSLSVLKIIAGLKYKFLKDGVSGEYLRHQVGEECLVRIDALDERIPLFELTQYLLSICVLEKGDVQDVAYVNALMDALRSYVAGSGSDAKVFLQYWDDKLHEQSVPVGETDSIQIMTIHTSKGLEAKNVFVPFCHWTIHKDGGYIWTEQQLLDSSCEEAIGLVPISHQKSMMEDSCYRDAYRQEHLAQQADQVNLLYVALTRAADRLYLGIPIQCTSEGFGFMEDYQDVGRMILSHLEVEQAGSMVSMQNAIEQVWADDQQETKRVIYSLGEEEWKEEEKLDRSKPDKPFSFEQVEEKMECVLHPENTGIRFVQSQESQQYALYGVEKGEERIRRKEFGTLCHDVLARVGKRQDLENVLQDFCDRSIIEDKTMLQEVRNLINKAWSNPQMCDWFSGRYTLLREEAMLALIDGQVEEKRMDRVMIDEEGKTAIVLDYKFGWHDQEDYHQQVRLYMNLLRRMGYQQVSGYLWYAHKGELVEVK